MSAPKATKTLLDLPNELLIFIARLLTAKKNREMACLCRRLNFLFKDVPIWALYCRHDWGIETGSKKRDWKEVYRRCYVGEGRYTHPQRVLTTDRTMHVAALHFAPPNLSIACYTNRYQRVEDVWTVKGWLYDGQEHTEIPPKHFTHDLAPATPSIHTTLLVAGDREGNIHYIPCASTAAGGWKTLSISEQPIKRVVTEENCVVALDNASILTLLTYKEEVLTFTKGIEIPHLSDQYLLAIDGKTTVVADDTYLYSWKRGSKKIEQLALPQSNEDTMPTALTIKGAWVALANFTSISLWDLTTSTCRFHLELNTHPVQSLTLVPGAILYLTQTGLWRLNWHNKETQALPFQQEENQEIDYGALMTYKNHLVVGCSQIRTYVNTLSYCLPET